MIRLRAQQLISPDFTEVKDVVAWMGAIQAQQPRMYGGYFEMAKNNYDKLKAIKLIKRYISTV